MSAYATVDDAIRFLADNGQPGMAGVVGRLHQSYLECRRAAASTLEQYYALKHRYEPMPNRPQSYRSEWE